MSAFVASFGDLEGFFGTRLESEAVLIAAGFAAGRGLLDGPVVVTPDAREDRRDMEIATIRGVSVSSGGTSLPPRVRIDQAKVGPIGVRFASVPGDGAFIPLPD